MADHRRTGASSDYSVVSHRSSATSASRAGGCVFSCNRCNKPLATGFFVCGCDCLFCEDCVYSHFNHSSSCPSCGQTLGSADFMELCIAEAPTTRPDEFKAIFQKVFTKGGHSSGTPYLQYMDACQTAIQTQEAARRVTQFVFKQFCLETSKKGESSGRLKDMYARLKEDYTQLQQTSSSQRLEAERAVTEAQNHVNSLQQQLNAKHQKNTELLQQVEFFRHQLANEGLTHPPSSPGSMARGSVPSRGTRGSHRHRRSDGSSRSGTSFGNGLAQPPPPLREVHASRQLVHRGNPDPTPIRIAPSFESTMTTGTGAPPIRNVRGGYVFSSRSSHNHHHSSSVGSSSSNGAVGGPVHRLQQSYASSRQSSFGRSNGGLSGGRR